MSIKLAYGLKDGKVVKVTEVANGLKCECICIDCKTRLIAANKGNKVRPHFKHYNNSKEMADCEASQETAIHYLAKEIITRNKSILLPQYSVTVPKHNGHGRRTHHIQKSKNIKFDFVENENFISTSQGYQDIRPDLIAYAKERQLFIEIAVTHPTENKKITRLKELGVSAIEIDLSKFDRMANEEELEKYIQKAPTKWLYHIKENEYNKMALENEKIKAEQYKYYVEKEKKERKTLEALQKKAHINFLQHRFPNYFENIILNSHYRGDLLSRIEKFIKSEYKNNIQFHDKSDSASYITCEIEGLDEYITIYNTTDFIFGDTMNISDSKSYVEIEDVNFMGYSFSFSIEENHSDTELAYSVIANIYYKASKLLCENLENKVDIQEDELLKKEKQEEEKWLERYKKWEEEKEEQKQKEIERKVELQRLQEEREQKYKIEEQRRFEEKEKRKVEYENLVYKTTMEIYAYKKIREPWKKEHPVMPHEVISKIKNKTPIFNEKDFIDMRLILQNEKNLFNRVDENKLATAIIVK